ncbi:outer membrane protein [Bradyrhizobium liaoningense]|uniref:outer membrane protein n=1 Tax=Bradyrhizobium liaoningense TaxID=43992 RepID=UPI001BAE44D7|nr:outer membrane beta-barrel protein [Bradyrhizobium liaoningense]
MRKLIAAGVVVSGMMLSPPALAADLPVKAKPVPLYNWTGWYGGVNAGYGWQDKSAAYTGDYFADPVTGLGGGAGTVFTDSLAISSLQASEEAAVNHPAYRQSLRASGFTGGGQFGYNWQIDRNWVTGFEADLQYADAKGSALFEAPETPGVRLSAASSHQLDWFGTLRGRIGYLITDRFLAFGTGGLAYGGTKAQATISIIGPMGWNVDAGFATRIICPGFTTCLAGSSSQTSVGWTAGGGLEYAVLPNVTIKAEYLHIDLGDQNVKLTVQSPATGNGFVNVKFSNAYDIVRMGMNFRF